MYGYKNHVGQSIQSGLVHQHPREQFCALPLYSDNNKHMPIICKSYAHRMQIMCHHHAHHMKTKPQEEIKLSLTLTIMTLMIIMIIIVEFQNTTPYLLNANAQIANWIVELVDLDV